MQLLRQTSPGGGEIKVSPGHTSGRPALRQNLLAFEEPESDNKGSTLKHESLLRLEFDQAEYE